MRTFKPLIVVLLSLAGGCANYTQPLAPSREMSVSEQNFEMVWQASVGTLHEYDFTTSPVRGGVEEKQFDPKTGQWTGAIRTLPMTGKQWFEFWRHDAATGRDLAESSLQGIYRTAIVTIKPKPDAPRQYAAIVTVETTRSDRPPTNSAVLPGSYSRYVGMSNPRSQDRFLSEQQEQLLESNAVITPLGRDKKLEDKISAKITAKIGSDQMSPAK
jgi:hypothetical protein